MKPNNGIRWMMNNTQHPIIPMRLMIMLALLFITNSLMAQETNSPDQSPEATLAILRETVIPQNDPFALAYQFYGIEAPPVTDNPVPFRQGDSDAFWVSDNNNGTTRQLTATLEVVSEYAYFWVENRQNVNNRELEALAQAFDADIYAQTRAIWGTEPLPGVDGDPRLHILFATRLGASSAAYFARRHNYPEEILLHSNAREMFFVNLSTNSSVNSAFLQSTLAHEFQHMIRANVTPNEEAWLNEGFSTFTEGYMGYVAANRYPEAFLTNPDTQLTSFGLSNNRLAEYGAGYLFVTYLYEQFGIEAIQALSENPLNGMFGVHDVVATLGAITAEEFFGNWVVANLIQDTQLHSSYGYQTVNSLVPVATQRLNGNDINVIRQVSQYATHYYALTDFVGGDTLEIELDIPQTVRLLPTDPTSGEKFWYSNRGDVSHTRLYREFDLTNASTATFTYQLWADLEADWDYGYLLISTDDGATWETIQTDTMTTNNPLGNLYGTAGYSLSTNGWIKESVILDAYVGQSVILSFELITDDAVNYAGMVVDDMAIPEIGYYTDFETDNGGWTSEGWVWVTNQIPQQAWIQVIQSLPNRVTVSRWFLPTGDGDIHPIILNREVESVVIAISAIAPVTTVPMEYHLTIVKN